MKDKIIEKRNQIAAMLYQNMSKIDADGTLILVDELAQLKAEAEKEFIYEEAEEIGLCDVEGCDLPSTNGGVSWRDTGYWRTCSKHFSLSLKGENQPKMRLEAIEREASRDKKTGWLPSKTI